MKKAAALVPGSVARSGQRCQENAAIAKRIGYPVIIKAAGGGGGRGMRVVHNGRRLASAIALTKSEAGQFFKNDMVYMEKYLENPRHIGSRCWLTARATPSIWVSATAPCSRHQKVVEEAPAPASPREMRKFIGERCVRAPVSRSATAVPAPSSSCTKTASSISSR